MAEEPQIFAYEGPTGRRVDTGEEKEFAYTVGPLTPADDRRLALAQQNFHEVRPEDFTVDGRVFTDDATGLRYRVVTADPTLQEDPRDTGIDRFFVTWDGYLVYLRPEDSQGRSKSVVMGSVGAVER